jgi:hypothetical protein
MRVTESVTYHSKSDDRALDPGIDVPILVDWVKTLTLEEQQEFIAAKTRQEQHRQEVIDAGKMIMINYSYVWKDQASAEQNKHADPIWVQYFYRWLDSHDMYIIRKMDTV